MREPANDPDLMAFALATTDGEGLLPWLQQRGYGMEISWNSEDSEDGWHAALYRFGKPAIRSSGACWADVLSRLVIKTKETP